jgi:hypothetical protein
VRGTAAWGRARCQLIERPEADGAFNPIETLLDALGAVAPAVARAVAASPVAGIVWLLAAAPGVSYVATSGLVARPKPGAS